MIELSHVTKSYATTRGEHVVLDDVCVRFERGTNIGILGRNGAGKSTLLRVVAGVEAPDVGEVVRQARVSWPIGFSGGFNGSLSGEENCRFVARIYGEDVDGVVEFARAFADIGEYFYMPIRTYSAGMRARLAFGVSMAIDFDVYLIDEVTAVGDAAFADKCRAAFAERRTRSTVIMVSHSMKTIQNYCDRCGVITHGSLKLYDSLASAARAYQAAA
jgi:capsular polysaccharide transport system ATP-binding protein